MQENKKNYNLISIMILSVFFGIASGVVGGIFAKSYILDNSFEFPFLGEINFSNGSYRGGDFIISGARKVVVEQSDKINEVNAAVRRNLVGIFKKNNFSDLNINGDDNFDLRNFYKIGQEVAEGLIITSDGWIITNFKPDNAKYVVITSEGKILDVDKILPDSGTSFYFMHVVASDLPVGSLNDFNDIRNGDLALLPEWNGKVDIRFVSERLSDKKKVLKDSDSLDSRIVLSSPISKDNKDIVVAGLSGDILGFINSKKEVEPVSHFLPSIRSLFAKGAISRPSLGVSYLDLGNMIDINVDSVFTKNKNGALIYKNQKGLAILKGGAGEIAGFKEGDIIKSINNINIDSSNDLTEVLQRFAAGDNVKIYYLRDNKDMEVSVQLGSR